MRQLEFYNNNLCYDFVTKFHTKITSIPKLSKMVLSISSSKKHSLISHSFALELISNQKSVYILKKESKKINDTAKYGSPVGCKVTIRKNNLLTIISNMLFLVNHNQTYTAEGKKITQDAIQFFIINCSSIEIIENNYRFFKELSRINVSLVFKNSKNSYCNTFLVRSLKI